MPESLFPRVQKRHRIFGGLNERQEHVFTWIAVVVVLLGPWMLGQLVAYTTNLYMSIPTLVGS